MISGKKLVVIMPAYNAEKTLRKTYKELPHEYIDEVILVDDYSKDDTSKWGQKSLRFLTAAAGVRSRALKEDLKDGYEKEQKRKSQNPGVTPVR